mgnify:CR=1 FL=1
MKKSIIAIMLSAIFLLSPIANVKAQGEREILELCSFSINNFYSQVSDSPASVYEESNGNQYLRLRYKNSEYSSFYFDCTRVIEQDGIYKFEADIRFNADLTTNNIFMSVFGDNGSFSKTIAANANVLNGMVTPTENSEWKRLSFTFTIDDFYLKSYQYFKFGFNTMGLEKNYMDIDNIRISLCTPMEFGTENIDIDKNGDFESFDGAYAFDKTGWHGDQTYYVSESGLENQVISMDGNRVLKLYTSDKPSTSITKALHLNAAKKGWYKLVFKAKGGANFYTNNLGFRINDKSGTGAHVGETRMTYTDINSQDWVTVEAPFYVEKTSQSPWLNLDLWVFTHNDDAGYHSDDNYLLVDDIKIVKLVSGGEYGENLFANGDISGFKSSQGRKTYSILFGSLVKDYPYTKDVIPMDALDQFEAGKKFVPNRAEENWWGTTSNDISAQMVDVEGYHAALLSYDGKQMTKTFSSLSYMFYLTEFSTKKYYTLEFDYKLEMASTDVVRVAFIGSQNQDDYMMNLAKAVVGVNYTEGVNKDLYSYMVEEKGDGWYHLRLIFQPNIDFKSRVTTLRFLNYTNFDQENKLYVANIQLTEYSDTEYPVFDSYTATEPILPESGSEKNIAGMLGIAGMIGSIAALTVIFVVVMIKKGRRGGGDENAK